MEIEILSDNRNPMLKRREISFKVEHEQAGSTPSRKEVRMAVAVALKIDENVVFVKRFVTKTGMQTATGSANVYESIEQAKLIEPEHIVNRNIPPEKQKEEAQG